MGSSYCHNELIASIITVITIFHVPELNLIIIAIMILWLGCWDSQGQSQDKTLETSVKYAIIIHSSACFYEPRPTFIARSHRTTNRPTRRRQWRRFFSPLTCLMAPSVDELSVRNVFTLPIPSQLRSNNFFGHKIIISFVIKWPESF